MLSAARFPAARTGFFVPTFHISGTLSIFRHCLEKAEKFFLTIEGDMSYPDLMYLLLAHAKFGCSAHQLKQILFSFSLNCVFIVVIVLYMYICL